MIKQEPVLRIFRALDSQRGLGAGYVSVTFSGVCFGPGPLARTCTGPVTRVIGSTFLPPPRSTRRSPRNHSAPSSPLARPWQLVVIAIAHLQRCVARKCVFVSASVERAALQCQEVTSMRRSPPTLPLPLQSHHNGVGGTQMLWHIKSETLTYNFSHGFSLWRHKRRQWHMASVEPGKWKRRRSDTDTDPEPDPDPA